MFLITTVIIFSLNFITNKFNESVCNYLQKSVLDVAILFFQTATANYLCVTQKCLLPDLRIITSHQIQIFLHHVTRGEGPTMMGITQVIWPVSSKTMTEMEMVWVMAAQKEAAPTIAQAPVGGGGAWSEQLGRHLLQLIIYQSMKHSRYKACTNC